MVRLTTHIWLIRPQWVNRPKTQNNTPTTESPVSPCNNQVLWWPYTVGMRDLSHPVYAMGLLFVIGSRCKAMMTFTERVTIWHNKRPHSQLHIMFVWNIHANIHCESFWFIDYKKCVLCRYKNNNLSCCCPDHPIGLGHTRHCTSSQIDIFSLYYNASRLRTTLPYGR